MRKIISYVLLSNCIVLFNKCSVDKNLNHVKFEGSYFYKNDNNIKIVFSKSQFAYIESDKSYGLAKPCCDTIAFGTWKHDQRGFLVLNSPDYLKTFFVNYKVSEKSNSSLDTLYFYITNPIEQAYRKNHSNGSELMYQLNVSAVGGFSGSFEENKRTFETTVIKYYNPNKLSIHDFSLGATAKSSLFVKNLALVTVFTLPYNVKSSNSNVFEISLPELTYGFFSYRRLNDDYVKIIDSNSLLWDGKEFIKKESE